MLHCKSIAIVLIWRRLSTYFGIFSAQILVLHKKHGAPRGSTRLKALVP